MPEMDMDHKGNFDEADKFIGVKIIGAKPMSLGEYNKYRGWDIPDNENPDDPGYLVIYPDGYQSWSPAKIFDEAYRRTDGMTFGQAIEAMRKGHRVQRVGWNGKDMFVYLVEGTNIVKSDLRGNAASAVSLREGLTTGPISSHQEICGHIDMMAADGAIVVGWLASQTDMLADDWQIV